MATTIVIDEAVAATKTVISREEIDAIEIEMGGMEIGQGIVETVAEIGRMIDLMIAEMRGDRGDGIGMKMMNLIPEADLTLTIDDDRMGDTKMKRGVVTMTTIHEEEMIQEEMTITMTVEAPLMILNQIRNRRVSSSGESEVDMIDRNYFTAIGLRLRDLLHGLILN